MHGDRYELLDVLGSGDTGEVWRGRDRITDRLVAIKVLHPQLASDPRLVDRFLRARHLLTGLWHPGIARLLDVIVDEDDLVLVTDLVPGVDLRHRMPLSPARAVQLGASIAGALAAAHRVGVVHGDIKPSNVVGEPAQLTDFSVALFVRAGHPRVSAYHPPDEIEGAVPGPAGDVYALGMLLRSHTTDLSTSEDLSFVVEDCLHPDPAARPDAQQVHDRLSAIPRHSAPTHGIRREVVKHEHIARRPAAARRRFGLVAAIVLTALVLVITAIVVMLSKSGPAPQAGGTTPTTAIEGPPTPPPPTWTQPGGAAFVGYWFATLSYASRTGDTSTLAGVTNAACGGCKPAFDAIKAGYADGGSLNGGSYLVREIRTSSLWTNDRPVYDVTVDRAPRSHLDRSGATKETLPALAFANCTLILEWVEGKWRVLEVPTSGCIA